jgi:hypothetical protein
MLLFDIHSLLPKYNFTATSTPTTTTTTTTNSSTTAHSNNIARVKERK